MVAGDTAAATGRPLLVARTLYSLHIPNLLLRAHARIVARGRLDRTQRADTLMTRRLIERSLTIVDGVLRGQSVKVDRHWPLWEMEANVFG